VMEVRASAGDNFLGGEDFVTMMVDAFLARSGLSKALDGRELNGQQRQRLRDEAERAKRTLSDAQSARMSLALDGLEHTWELDEDMLAKLCEPLIQRLRQPVERALRDATIRASDLDAVVLAGGATRMPIVRKLVSRMFGRFPNIHLDPDQAIALGAAVQAGLKMRDAALDEIVMTDVAPYSMGIGIARQVGPQQYESGHYLPIIDRNSVVPVSRVKEIATIHDNQKALNVQIYQGEARMVSDNVFLGTIEFPVPPKKAGEVSAEVRFTYDISGVLEAEITVAASGDKHKLVITENAGVMTPEQIEQRLGELAALKIHPRDQIENRTLVAEADRLYETLLGNARDLLAQHIAWFQATLNKQNPAEIRRARDTLKELMQHLDGGSFL
jgi:molecular chaperone HscC